MLRRIVALALVLLVAAAAAPSFAAGRGAPPPHHHHSARSRRRPGRHARGHRRGARSARFTALDDRRRAERHSTTPLFSLDGAQTATLTAVDATHLTVSRPFGKQSVPGAAAGAARIVVTATRASFLNLRTLSSDGDASDIQVRLEPPRIAVAVDAPLREPRRLRDGRLPGHAARLASGVRVGDVEYPGFPRRARACRARTRR